MNLSPAKPQSSSQSCRYVFREAHPDDAHKLVACYESVFGPGGIRASGHEPYPAPEVFFEAGVLQIINDPLRQFMVMEIDGDISSGMIISLNSRFHREFGCVAVSQKFQGQGISSLMLKEAKALERRQSLSINVTEIVTHSMLSQSAHRNAGFGQITGFGFCQYPHVFFSNHPESCLWITSFEGRVIEALKQLRPSWIVGNSGTDAVDVELTDFEQSLFEELSKQRPAYISSTYTNIVSKISSQYSDIFCWKIQQANVADVVNLEDTRSTQTGLDGINPSATRLGRTSDDWQIEDCDEYPYSYLNLPQRKINEKDILEKLRRLDTSKKRYLQARVPTAHPSAIENVELLRSLGFAFLGWIPLYRCINDETQPPTFEDVLIMQWIRPDILRANSLPGETDSVAKLHGFPLNLTGDLIATMRQDLFSPNRRDWSSGCA